MNPKEGGLSRVGVESLNQIDDYVGNILVDTHNSQKKSLLLEFQILHSPHSLTPLRYLHTTFTGQAKILRVLFHRNTSNTKTAWLYIFTNLFISQFRLANQISPQPHLRSLQQKKGNIKVPLGHIKVPYLPLKVLLSTSKRHPTPPAVHSGCRHGKM